MYCVPHFSVAAGNRLILNTVQNTCLSGICLEPSSDSQRGSVILSLGQSFQNSCKLSWGIPMTNTDQNGYILMETSRISIGGAIFHLDILTWDSNVWLMQHFTWMS